MKNCSNCQALLNDDAKFCTVCGTAAAAVDSASAPVSEAPQNPFPQATPSVAAQPQPFVPAAPTDNRKLYSLLSYIGILWLFGLCSSPEKTDPRVRFNVGQGIIKSIVCGGLIIVAIIINSVIKAVCTTSKSVFGYTYYEETSPVGLALIWIISLIVSAIEVFYTVYGIIKVSGAQDNYLPIIGKMTFYK